jgi:hypothetical protein
MQSSFPFPTACITWIGYYFDPLGARHAGPEQNYKDVGESVVGLCTGFEWTDKVCGMDYT